MRIEWRTCPLNHRYEVSNHGFVRNTKTKHIMRPYLIKGYFRIQLSHGKRGSAKAYLINRLVLITFEGFDDNPAKNQAAHKNGNSLDNRIENLKWKDRFGNAVDKIEHGTTNRVLTEEDVLLMRNYYSNGQTQNALAKHFNTSRTNVQKIVNGHRWKI